ncbi:MAG: (d)CMP kinase [Phycisphaerales bacterium]
MFEERMIELKHRLIVTIDGPAGTGKSSVARDLAAALSLEFLDTGAMYRAATALALDAGVPVDDEHAVSRLVRRADLRFDWSDDPPRLYAAGRDMTERIRDADVNAHVSIVASLPEVRTVLVEAQRRIGEAHPFLVSEGRDQGSVVFHDARVKFFLDASVEVRARRRAAQLREMGRHDEADEAKIAAQIAGRDRIDSTRAVGPLCCPSDAQRLDTSDLSQRQVVEALLERVRAAVPERVPQGAGA